MFTTRPFTEDLGCIVEPHGTTRLVDVPIEEVMALLRRRGVVYFRGFDADLPEFETFAKCFEAVPPRPLPEGLAEGYANAKTQAQVQAFVQTTGAPPPLVTRDVNPSQNALHVHSENSYLPFPIELLWFYCVRPAKERGRTTLVDGERLLALMDEPIRDFFTRKKISYNTTYSPDAWSSIFRTDDLSKARAILDRLPGVTHRVDEGSTLRVRFSTPAIKPTKYTRRDAFINQVMNGFFTPHFGLRMEDDEPIPTAYIERLLALIDQIVVPIPWRAREFALVDNTRVLHGREDFIGDDRRYVRVMEIQNGLP